jgi:hypothetical protein
MLVILLSSALATASEEVVRIYKKPSTVQITGRTTKCIFYPTDFIILRVVLVS